MRMSVTGRLAYARGGVFKVVLVFVFGCKIAGSAPLLLSLRAAETLGDHLVPCRMNGVTVVGYCCFNAFLVD